MNFYDLFYLLDNVNTRSIEPSGGAGIKPQKPGTPQKGEAKPTGGAFSPGTESPKDTPSSPFNVTSKDQPSDLKKFDGRPISPFQSLFPQLKPFTPPPGPMLPRFGKPPKRNDPTKLKKVEPPKLPD